MTENVFNRMAPQREGDGAQAGVHWRVAMELGAAMAEANREVARPSVGVEVAERAAAAARAAVLVTIDNANLDSPGMHLPVVQWVAQQAYGTEWQRLMTTPREMWQ